MTVRIPSIGQVAHLTRVSGGQPFVETGQAGRGNCRANPGLREAQVGSTPPQLAGQYVEYQAVISAVRWGRHTPCAVAVARHLCRHAERAYYLNPPGQQLAWKIGTTSTVLPHCTTHLSWNTSRNNSMNRP